MAYLNPRQPTHSHPPAQEQTARIPPDPSMDSHRTVTEVTTFRKYETPSGDTCTLPEKSHEVADIVDGIGS